MPFLAEQEPDSHNVAPINARKRRWRTFRLRSLFVALALIALCFSGIRHLIVRIPDESRLAKTLVERRWSVQTKSVDVPFRLAEPRVLVDSIGCRGDRVTDADLELIAQCSAVHRLTLESPRVSDRGLVCVETLTTLEVLHLSTTTISDAGMWHLAKLTNLTRLDLSGTKITDAGLRHLRDMTALQWLSLQGTRIQGDGLQELSQMQSLHFIDISDTLCDDRALQHLARLKSLHSPPHPIPLPRGKRGNREKLFLGRS